MEITRLFLSRKIVPSYIGQTFGLYMKDGQRWPKVRHSPTAKGLKLRLTTPELHREHYTTPRKAIPSHLSNTIHQNSSRFMVKMESSNPQSPSSTTVNPSPTSVKTPTALASPYLTNVALPEPRQQTYEELYAPPENILEIEVSVFNAQLESHSTSISTSLPVKSLPLVSLGTRSPDSRYWPKHVHRLRDLYGYQYSGIQA